MSELEVKQQNPIDEKVNIASKDEEESSSMPKKRFFRSRAHCNPLSHNDSFSYPVNPSSFDWSALYPGIPEENRIVRILDMGMGFGGLTVAMSELFPDKLVLGMEIRAKVCEYVRLRIEALRKEHCGSYQNASCYRTNCMRYLPNFFRSGQLEKIFICFPDPHFKAKNHRRRIINSVLLSEYAHLLQPNGRLYTITDVEELYNWHVAKCDAHPYFERIDQEPGFAENDAATQAMLTATEESKKVSRNDGKKYVAVYRRIEDFEFQQRKKFKLLKLFS